MKSIAALSLLLALTLTSPAAPSPNREGGNWPALAGPAEISYSALAVHPSGSVYGAGHFRTGAFLYGATTLSRLGGTGEEGMVTITSWNGQPERALLFRNGDDFPVRVHSLAIHPVTGDTVVMGTAVRGVDITDGTTTQSLPGATPPATTIGLFVAKFSGGTNLVWSFKIGGTDGPAQVGTDLNAAKTIAVDAAGNVYLIGRIVSGVTIRGAFGSSKVRSNLGDQACFLAKFRPDGSLDWANMFDGGNGNDYVSGLALDRDGTVFVTGRTAGSAMTFEDTASPTALTLTVDVAAPTKRLFVAAYNPAGRALRGWLFGSDNDTEVRAIITDDTKVVVSGKFRGNFGLAATSDPASYDSFVVAFDKQGTPLWGNGIGNGSGGQNEIVDLAMDDRGDVLFAGAADNGAILESGGLNVPTSGGVQAPSFYGFQAGYLGKLTGATGRGQWIEAIGAGQPASSQATALALGLAGQIRLAVNSSGDVQWKNASIATLGTGGSLIHAVDEGPRNDAFASRLTLTGTVAQAIVVNRLATREAGEPDHAGVTGGNAGLGSVWWRWVAPGNGLVTLDTAGSQQDPTTPLDTLLAVYTGPALNAPLVPVAGNDDAAVGTLTSRLTFVATANEEYQIAADGKGGRVGQIRLNLVQEVPNPGVLQFAQSLATVAENAGTVTLSVTRTGGSLGAVGVSVATADGTATAGQDYTAYSGTLAWASGETAAKSVTVSILDDILFEEATEAFTVGLSTPTGGAQLGAIPTTTVSLTDNDALPANYAIESVGAMDASQYSHIAVTADGTVYFTGGFSVSHVGRLRANGTLDVFAGQKNAAGLVNSVGTSALFGNPMGIALDTQGNLVIADYSNGAVRKLEVATASASTFATGLSQPYLLAIGSDGTVLVTTDAVGNWGTIRKISPTADITTLSGPTISSGPANGASLAGMTGLTLTPNGDAYASVPNGNTTTIYRIQPNGSGSVLATVPSAPSSYGLASRNGYLAVPSAHNGQASIKFIASNGTTTDLKNANGVPYTSATGGITAMTVGANGLLYWAVGSVAVFKATPVTANNPPAFTQQPTRTATVLAGGTLTLSVTATGTAPLTYQWRKGGANLPGQTSTTLSVPNVTPADAGDYDCAVNNVVTTLYSDPCTVTVLVPPAITTPPQPVSVSQGQPAQFSVTASGSPAPALQWLKNGTPIPGQTSATLAFASAQPADVGFYSVTVTNIAGGITSAPVQLTVGVLPTIDTPPVHQTLTNGALTLTVTASGPGPLTYQWRRNGVDLPGATTATFTVPAPTTADAGRYTVVVGNAAGTVASMAADVEFFGDLKFYSGTIIAGPIGKTYRVEHTPSLAGTPVWTLLREVTLPVSPYLVIDENSPGEGKRFYRALPVP